MLSKWQKYKSQASSPNVVGASNNAELRVWILIYANIHLDIYQHHFLDYTILSCNQPYFSLDMIMWHLRANEFFCLVVEELTCVLKRQVFFCSLDNEKVVHWWFNEAIDCWMSDWSLSTNYTKLYQQQNNNKFMGLWTILHQTLSNNLAGYKAC